MYSNYLKLRTWFDHMLCNKSRQCPIYLWSELRILTSYWLANGLAEFLQLQTAETLAEPYYYGLNFFFCSTKEANTVYSPLLEPIVRLGMVL